MSVKALYSAIKTKIETDVPEIKTVRLYNNQFDKDNVEMAFPYPCLFIEFTSIEWENEHAGISSSSVAIAFHIGFQSLENENIDFLDTTQKVFNTLNGFTNEKWSPMIRTSEQQDTDHGNVWVWIQNWFVDKLIDCSGFIYKNNQTVTVNTLEFTAELDVDNLVIRTGDGQ